MSKMQIVGEVSLYLVPMLCEKEIVKALIPKWLKLMPAPSVSADKHPIIFTFAHERRVHFQWGVLASPGFKFEEVALGTPYVQLADTGLGPFYNFPFPRIYLNGLLATISGKYWWGFDKVRTNIQTKDGYFEVTAQNRLLISGKFKECGKAGKPSDFPLLEDMVRQKLIGGLPLVDKTFYGTYACTQISLNWEKIVIQPVEASVHVGDSFISGMPTTDYTIKGIDEVSLGGVHLRSSWTMGMPIKCVSENSK